MFLDTSGLLCLADDTEPRHLDAVAIAQSVHKAVTHSYVLSEFVALANSRRIDRRLALRFLDGVRQEPKIEIVYVDEPLHLKAMDLLRGRFDKSWSLCDAVSFELMERIGLTEALTTDHHFEQAGFVRLLNA